MTKKPFFPLYGKLLNQKNENLNYSTLPNQIELRGISAELNKIWENSFEKAYQENIEKDRDILKELQLIDKMCEYLSLKALPIAIDHNITSLKKL